MSQYDQVFADWLETDTIVNFELSPATTLSDLPHPIPEHDEYQAMPHSLRHVLVPPYPEPAARPRSILLEPVHPNMLHTPSPYSRHRWSASPDPPTGGVYRARQSVSSIGSCSTVHTRSAPPIKSILTRHDSGVSMATKSTRKRKKRSPPSVKFVDAPTVHYDDGVYYNPPSPRSPPSSPSGPQQPMRWFTKWWKKSPAPPLRPPISGPYHISYTASLVDVRTTRTPKPKLGRLKQLWHRLTSVIN